jgi:peptidoglycan L-alanyl-D-glutamate endopeptidase CwlK
MTLSPGSERRLAGVHPDLVRVVRRAASIAGTLEFIVIEGLRDIARQTLLVSQGRSRTMHSRHLTGHAVDLAVLSGGEVSWAWPSYQSLALLMDSAAKMESVTVEWGGTAFGSFRDGPHFQLPRDQYPAVDPSAPDQQVLASAPAAGQPPQT